MLGVGEQLLRGLVLLDLAVVDEDDAVGHLTGKAHFVGDHQHGDAGVGQLLHQLQHLADHFRIECTGWLIKNENMIEEILTRVPKGTEEINRKAFSGGVEAVRAMK